VLRICDIAGKREMAQLENQGRRRRRDLQQASSFSLE
jgi:hypothetical protein